ncbi:hypothetical protein GOBAR_AA28901 [Gossypium barbadense]|uniref:Uncharacterized protein n=1 Tax=Gossypium barbadense TaxID=3634 RepID=A0A2P5WL14_GOSBA|nr:hypothetical protein GOBAR_AA28901 [Gossypium barbadense]
MRGQLQILNPSMRGETIVTAPTKCTNKKEDKETAGRTQESRNMKKAKFKYPPKYNLFILKMGSPKPQWQYTTLLYALDFLFVEEDKVEM